MDKKEELLAGLKEAMIAERTGIEFYTTAAEKTADPKGKEVFQRLAEEERKHLEYLHQQFGYLTGNNAEPQLDIQSGLDQNQASPIFSPELRQRIKTAHWEMTALAVGVALEQASINHYQQLARQAETEEVRRFFDSLVRWEQSHATALQKQYNYLRESYWYEAGFAPF